MIQLINSWVGIVVGLLTGIGLLYGFYKWIGSNRRTAKVPGQVIIENGNLFGIYPTSERTQFTFSDRDSNPILLKKKKKIFYLRSETKQGLDIEDNLRNYQSYSFMIFNLKTFEEDLLTDQKPYWDGLNMSFEILAPRSIKAHPNGESILCIIEKYATASELISIDIKGYHVRLTMKGK